VYSLVWGQCTDVMRQRVEALANFESMSTKGDGLALLQSIKDLVYNFQSLKYLPHALDELKRCFYQCLHGKYATTATYLEKFQNMLDVIKHSGGSIGEDPGILESLITKRQQDLTIMTDDKISDANKEAQEQYLAVAFLLSVDHVQYGQLIEDLENNYLVQGQDNYPEMVTAAYNLLTNWKQSTMRVMGAPIDGVSFANINHEEGTSKVVDMTLATDGQSQANINYKGKH
jgi:hypothetical protein